MVEKVKGLPEDKPFLLLKGLSKDFLIASGLGTEYLHICPRCGVPVTHSTKVIYVAAEDQVMCVKCAERWLEYTRYYKEDEGKEESNYKAMVQKLKDSKLWMK